MAIDASIYQGITAPKPIEQPDFAGSMQKGLTLSNLGMQNQVQQQQLQTNQAVKALYAKHTGADGQLNQQGFVSDLAKVNPQSAMEYQGHFAKLGKEAAEAQSAKMDAVGKIVEQTLPPMKYLAGLPEDQRAAAYNTVMKQLEAQGAPMTNIPKDSSGNFMYDPAHFRQSYSILNQTAENLAMQKTQSEIGKNISEIGQGPAKLNAEKFGSRSPNAELTSQYTKEPAISVARSSQVAMNQMIDNYNHPSPQGDASLVLNAFKIKFPNVPDVNSLEELTKSQAASDTWKNMATHALSGGLDQPTRDNLMRDGVSTFRANRDSLKDTQSKYGERAKAQNVDDSTFMLEPAVEKTYAQAMKLQDKIGPYVPPSERGGVSGAISKIASKVLGVGGGKTANAASTPKHGTVEDGFVFMGGNPADKNNWKKAR